MSERVKAVSMLLSFGQFVSAAAMFGGRFIPVYGLIAFFGMSSLQLVLVVRALEATHAE